MDKCAEESAI